MNDRTLFDNAEVIYAYTRAQAISDGVLVELEEAAQAGFKIPVAITQAAWQECIAWSEGDEERKPCGQSPSGRAWDVLTMLRYAARKGGPEVRFSVLRVPRDGKSMRPQPVKLKAICGPGDSAEPVITIMLPDED
jgi:Family of unknown function (DUF6573)